MKTIVLKIGETAIPCISSEVITVSNVIKERNGVIVDVSYADGNTHVEISSTDANRPRYELKFDLVGRPPEWAVIGQELKYQTER